MSRVWQMLERCYSARAVDRPYVMSLSQDVERLFPDMPSGAQRIHVLVGELSEIFWRDMGARNGEPGFSAFQSLLDHYEGEARPLTAEEAHIWDQLTSPRNYAALVDYVGYWKSGSINDYSTRLQEALLAEAERRRGCEPTGGA